MSLARWHSPLPSGLVGHVVRALSHDLIHRYQFATHGHQWASFAALGSCGVDAGPASLDAVRAMLTWMRDHDVIPSDAASAFADA